MDFCPVQEYSSQYLIPLIFITIFIFCCTNYLTTQLLANNFLLSQALLRWLTLDCRPLELSLVVIKYRIWVASGMEQKMFP